jgi:hypothetical protein
MPPTQVQDERSAVFSWSVVKSVRRRVAPVQQNHTFESRRQGRECTSMPRRLGLAPPDNTHMPSVDMALQTLPWSLKDVARID